MPNESGFTHTREADIIVRMLGPTIVEVAGAPIHLHRSDARLLGVIAAHRGVQERAAVQRQLDDASPRSVSSSIYRLRRQLGESALATRRGLVGLNRDLVSVDIDVFAELTGPSLGMVEPHAFEKALSLVRGTPFADLPGDHWQNVRTTWTARIIATASRLCDHYAADGNTVEAVRLARQLTAVLPDAPEAWSFRSRLVQQIAPAAMWEVSADALEHRSAASARGHESVRYTHADDDTLARMTQTQSAVDAVQGELARLLAASPLLSRLPH